MKKAVLILMLGLSANANAGLFGITHHSRANCANNETISWDAKKQHWFATDSTHNNMVNGVGHIVRDDFRKTRRSAAVCWAEGLSGWMVIGRHYIKEHENEKVKMVKMEVVYDCSLDEGWWGIWEDVKSEK